VEHTRLGVCHPNNPTAFVSLWFPHEGTWWETIHICEAPGDKPVAEYTTDDFADMFAYALNQYGHARFWQYSDRDMYGMAKDDQFVIFSIHTPEGYVTRFNPDGSEDFYFVRDEDFQAKYGMPKVVFYYGSEPDFYPGWLWDFVYSSSPVAEEIEQTVEVVVPAIYDALLDHKREIAGLTADVGRDVAHDMGYTSVPAMIRSAVKSALDALPFRNIIDALPFVHRDPGRLLPWKGHR
jgi:hypothetical protein